MCLLDVNGTGRRRSDWGAIYGVKAAMTPEPAGETSGLWKVLTSTALGGLLGDNLR